MQEYEECICGDQCGAGDCKARGCSCYACVAYGRIGIEA